MIKKFCSKYFQEFPKFSLIMLFQYSHYACIMLLGKQQFFYSNVKCECCISLQSNYSIREYRSKGAMYHVFLPLQLPLTVLLGSVNLFLKRLSSILPPNMLALCYHNTLAYYSLYYAYIFDGGLIYSIILKNSIFKNS